VLEKNQAGRLLVYRELDPNEVYAIGADVGLGVRDGDWSVAHVLDSQKRQVAVFRGQVDPHYFATILKAIGTVLQHGHHRTRAQQPRHSDVRAALEGPRIPERLHRIS
jgi:hypothetical protein